MEKTSNRPYNENVVITLNVKEEHLDLTKVKSNSSQEKLSEITQTICALFNSCEGYLKLHFDDESVALKAHDPKAIDDLVRRIEQSLMKFVGAATVTDAFKLEKTPQGEQGLLFSIKSTKQFCTVAYNLYVPTDFQINPIGPGDTTKKVAAILASGKQHYGAVIFPQQDMEFVYGEKVPKGLREGQTAQFKLLKNEPAKNITLADRMMNKTNKVVNCVSAFGNKNGGKVYFGIDDKTYIVKGQVVSIKERKKIEKIVSGALSKMEWPVKNHTNFYHLAFVPVVIDGQHSKDTFVIVLSVAQCPGGVFVAEPESYEIDNGKVSRIKMPAWKEKVILDATSDCTNNADGGCSRHDGCSSSMVDHNVEAGSVDNGACTCSCTNYVGGCKSKDPACSNSDTSSSDNDLGGGSSNVSGCRNGGVMSSHSFVAKNNTSACRENSAMGGYNNGAATDGRNSLTNFCMGVDGYNSDAAGFNTGVCSSTGGGYYTSNGDCRNIGGVLSENVGVSLSPGHAIDLASSGNLQAYIPNHVRVIGWNSSKQLEDYMKVTQHMENLRNNGNWAEIDRIKNKILVPENTDADLKLTVIFQCIAASYRQTKNKEAHEQLVAYHDLLKLAKNPAIFEVQELYSWSAIKRSEQEYKKSYQYTYHALQKMQFIVPGWITAWYLCNAASLLTIFACETTDPKEKMLLVDQAVCYYREALEHGKSILSYKKAAANLKHRVHINLAMLYMQSSPNASNTNFEVIVAPEVLKTAEESIKAAEDFKGPTMSDFNEFHFLLAKSDLYFRYFQLNPNDYQRHLKKAIDYANRASGVAQLHKFKEVLHYADTRLTLLNSVPLKNQNTRDTTDSILNDISS